MGLSCRRHQSWFCVMATVTSKNMHIYSYISGNTMMPFWHEKCLLEERGMYICCDYVLSSTSYLHNGFSFREQTAFPPGLSALKTLIRVTFRSQREAVQFFLNYRVPPYLDVQSTLPCTGCTGGALVRRFPEVFPRAE